MATHSWLVSPFLSRTAVYDLNFNQVNVPDFAISAGDGIRVTVAVSSTSGNVTIENLTKQHTANMILTSNSTLCGQQGVWFLEDMDVDNPLIDFGSLTYTNVLAFGNETYYTLDDSGLLLYDMVWNGQTVATASTDGSSVTIKYDG